MVISPLILVLSLLLNFCQEVLNFLPQAEATIMATSAWRKSSKVGGGAGKVKLLSFLARRSKS
jgi:hypothetical protein